MCQLMKELFMQYDNGICKLFDSENISYEDHFIFFCKIRVRYGTALLI